MKARYLLNTIEKELKELNEELYDCKIKDVELKINEYMQQYVGKDVIFEIDEGFSDPWYISYYGKIKSVHTKFDLYNGIRMHTEIESYKLSSLDNYVSRVLSDAEIKIDFLRYKQRNTLNLRKREFDKIKKQAKNSGISPIMLKVLIFPYIKLYNESNKKAKNTNYPDGLGIIKNLYVIEP